MKLKKILEKILEKISYRAGNSAVLLFWVVLAASFSTLHIAHAMDLGEYEIKAAYLHKFCQLVTWPESLSVGPIVISIIGEDPFGESIDKIFAGKKVNGRSLVIRRASPSADIRGSHIIFVGKLEETEIESFLESVKEESVLTVGEVDHFVRSGGIIGFVKVDDHIRLEINILSARRQELQLSSHLMSVAEIFLE